MALKFRKRIKIAPGINLNLSKSGISTSMGKPGATVNIGKKGVKTTVGIPGTGISWSSTSRVSSQNTLEEEHNDRPGFWSMLFGLIEGVIMLAKSIVMLAVGCFVLWILFKILGAIVFS
ncbi:DUF4236 domain-containing protein [Aeromonas dhakensis]|uniref:DUF4236 domain-containing protein n=1 Tax=Aeromonas TaxID=642 RepID=UPI0018A7E003|nr:DUF4236 domain-containing protein [Aeromonas dhakensis]MBF8451216.1 DUF4236 domain-containing protein [Aeromonas dhakensis]